MKSHHLWVTLAIVSVFVSFTQAAEIPLTTWKFTVNGVARSALVYIPESATTLPTPVIFCFHGHSEPIAMLDNDFKFEKRWPEAIVIYPQGLAGVRTHQDLDAKQVGWQLGPGDQGNRDVLFFDQMFARVQASCKVDLNRVYCAGFSNGAYFTFVLWHERPSIFAAYAPCSGGSKDYGRTLKPTPAILQVEDDPGSPVQYAQKQTKADILAAENCNSSSGQTWPDASPTNNPAPPIEIFYSSPPGSNMVYWVFHGRHRVLQEEAEQVVTFFKLNTRTSQ